MTVPYWVADSIFYQIFPDRFANGNPLINPPNVQPWGAQPTNFDFQGGDLRGIMQHFDYLLDLGINAIYLNPIFQSASNHRYNTFDYYKIDPKLGNKKDFQRLLDLAHRNNIRVIIDGVFNHCGRGFFAFNDILENENHSPYKDWFHIKSYPLDAYTPGEAINYSAWWQLKSLPKFNTNNPLVRQYLFDVAKYWIEQGVDGWRLDVPNEIDDDPFWQEFRHVVTTANKDAYLLGEIWTIDPRWANDKHFDGLMNYPLREAILRILHSGTLEISQFATKVETLLTAYPTENINSMYNPLGSHDTERLFTKVECDTQKAKLAFLFQFAYPGAPAIYYGDEVGLQGGKDPDCRRAFPWDQSSWNLELFYWVKTLVSLRNRFPAIRKGNFTSVYSDDSSGYYVFSRRFGDEQIVVAINVSNQSQPVEIPVSKIGWTDGRQVLDLFTNKKTNIIRDSMHLSLAPWSGTWLI